MAKIEYEVDGKKVEIEVSEEFAAGYNEADSESKRNDWKHERRAKRHGCSWDAIVDGGFQQEDRGKPLAEIVEDAEAFQKIMEIIATLSLEQQEFIRRIFFEYETEQSIADEMGVSKQAINQRKERILEQIRKKIKNF